MSEKGGNAWAWLFRPEVGGLALLFLGVFALYLYQLDGASLWRDEALSVIRAEQALNEIFANRNIVQGIASPDLHPPLYFLMLHLWQQAVGQSEFAYRLPSVFFMLLALAMFYQVGRQIWGKETAVFSLLLAIVSPFFYWYARETRMYALLVLETAIFYRLLWSALQPGSRWWHFLMLGVTGLCLVMTQYTGLFVLAFALAIFLLQAIQKRPHWGWWLTGLLLLLIGGIVLAPHLLELLSLPEFFAFSQRQLWVLAQEGVNTFSLGSAGPMENAGWRLLPFIFLGIVGMFTVGVKPTGRRWRVFLMGTGGVLLTLLAFFAASWFKANYSNPRHLTVLAVPWFLLLGHGLTTVWRQQKLVAVGLILVAIGLSGEQLWQTAAAPPIVKDDVRALADYIAARQQPGDLVLWHDAIMMTTYDYYALDLPYTAVPHFGAGDPEAALEALAQLHETYNRIWFVSDPPPTYFNPKLIPNWLTSRRIQADAVDFPASWSSLHLSLLERADTTSLPEAAMTVNLTQDNYQLQAVLIEERFGEEGVWASLYWRTSKRTIAPPIACLRLQDSSQAVWSEGCAPLTLPEGWEPGEEGFYRQQLWLPLSRGIPPLTYDLFARLDGQFEFAGKTTIAAWQSPPPERNVASYHETGLQLVSLNWHDDAFRAGLWAVGHLLWYVDETPPADSAVNLRLVDLWGRTIAEESFVLGSADHAAEQWGPASYEQTLVNIPLPFEANGRYRLQVQLMNGNTVIAPDQFAAGEWETAGWVEIESWPFTTTIPDDAVSLDGIAFGEAISLAGYQINRTDENLTVDLFWQSNAPVNNDYGVFVHVGQPDQAPLVQSSSEPANWQRPTSSWRAGEIVADSHQLVLPPLDPAEAVQIMVGFYDLVNPNNRLPLTVAGTAVPGNSYTLQPLPPADN